MKVGIYGFSEALVLRGVKINGQADAEVWVRFCETCGAAFFVNPEDEPEGIVKDRTAQHVAWHELMSARGA